MKRKVEKTLLLLIMLVLVHSQGIMNFTFNRIYEIKNLKTMQTFAFRMDNEEAYRYTKTKNTVAIYLYYWCPTKETVENCRTKIDQVRVRSQFS